MQISRTRAALGVMGVLVCAGLAMGQTPANGPRTTAGNVQQRPDVIVSTVGSGINNYGTLNGITAYAIATVSCNIGTHEAIWIDGTGAFGDQHPVIGGQIYRLFNGRFEQIGISSLKHGFCAADAPNCINLVSPPGTYASNGSCDWLGRFATDTYGAGLNGAQSSLGPRSEVNPWGGLSARVDAGGQPANIPYPSWPYPPLAGTSSGDCINKRLQVRKTELSNNATTGLFPGARYFGEIVYIVTDEWPEQRYNNYSYREIAVGSNITNNSSDNSCAATETGPNLTFSANTVPMKIAMEAWKTADPTVTIVYADAPNDGRVAIGTKVTDRGNGTWQYEYAILNMNVHRSFGSFSVPKSAAASVQVTSQDMRSPEFANEPYSKAKWAMSVNPSNIFWNTEDFASNANANALRWSYQFNYRFIANRPPVSGTVRLGLFKNAQVAGDPNFMDITGVPVPSNPPCRTDIDSNGVIEVPDIFGFLSLWFNSSLAADFDNNNVVEVADIFSFLSNYFAQSCP